MPQYNPQKGPYSGQKVGHSGKIRQIPQMTPEQMQIFSQMQGMVGPDSFLAKLAGGDPEMFAQLEAPALRQFTGIQGNLASKFSGMGLGARHSSGFGNEMSGAAQDFASQLQSQRLGLQNQAVGDMMNYINMILGQKPYATVIEPKQQKTGGWGGAMTGAMSGAGTGAALGPWGALGGGLIGGAMGYFS